MAAMLIGGTIQTTVESVSRSQVDQRGLVLGSQAVSGKRTSESYKLWQLWLSPTSLRQTQLMITWLICSLRTIASR